MYGSKVTPDMPPSDSACWPSTASRPPLRTGRGSKMSRWGEPPCMLWESSCLPVALLMLPSDGPEHSTAYESFQLSYLAVAPRQCWRHPQRVLHGFACRLKSGVSGMITRQRPRLGALIAAEAACLPCCDGWSVESYLYTVPLPEQRQLDPNVS